MRSALKCVSHASHVSYACVHSFRLPNARIEMILFPRKLKILDCKFNFLFNPVFLIVSDYLNLLKSLGQLSFVRFIVLLPYLLFKKSPVVLRRLLDAYITGAVFGRDSVPGIRTDDRQVRRRCRQGLDASCRQHS